MLTATPTGAVPLSGLLLASERLSQRTIRGGGGQSRSSQKRICVVALHAHKLFSIAVTRGKCCFSMADDESDRETEADAENQTPRP